MKTQLYHTALQALKEHRLNDALQTLKELLKQKNNWRIASQLSELSVSYDMMLQYLERGIDDKERPALYAKFIRKAYELADDTYISLSVDGEEPETAANELIESVRLLEETEKAMQQNKYDGESSLYKEHEQRLNKARFEGDERLFQAILKPTPWEGNAEECMQSLLASPFIAVNDKALSVSAATLSLLRRFDARKYGFLLRCYQSASEDVLTQRAFVGMIFVLIRYYDRMEAYPEIKAHFHVLADEPRFQKDLSGLQIQLYMAMETQNIQRRMQEDIIPSMLKNPHFKPTKFGFEETDFLPPTDEANPEWEEGRREIEKKIEQLAELQAEGADIYMGTFSNLKRFPFFNRLANWFLPFETTHPAVASLFSDSGKREFLSLIQLFLLSDSLCDSDKYSFCLMAASMPTMQMDLVRQLIDKFPEADEQTLESMRRKNLSAAVIRKHYLQDLYRYIKLCPQKRSGDDVFHRQLATFIDYPLLRGLFRDFSLVQSIADFAFKRELYDTAIRFYDFLGEKQSLTAEVLQKMAYCHQQTKHYDEAIRLLEKANLLKPNSRWVLTHLAQCYGAVGLQDKACVYYQMLELMAPEDASVLFAVGRSLVHNKEYGEALQRFYKLDFLTPNNGKVQRAIAWCLMLTHKPEQASVYYRRLLDRKPKAEDYLNAGHAAWAQGHLADAVPHYVEAFRRYGVEQTRDIIQKLQEDADDLQQFAITADDLCIMADLIAKHLWPVG